MKHYTKNVPKPLIKIKGTSLLETIVKKLEDYSFRKIVINIFYLKNQIKNELKNKFKLKILFSEEKNTFGHSI